MTMMPLRTHVLRLFAILLSLLIPSAASLRAFLLVGQSNMEGKGSIAHLDQLLNDPTTRNTYQHLKTGTEWAERDDVTIRFNDDRGEGGKLSVVGYSFPSDRFGPELEFGNVVGDAFNEQILLIKCSWGGSDLAVDFRPPSSGLGNYSLCDDDGCKPHDPRDYGALYRKTIKVVQDTLEDYNSIVQGGLRYFNIPTNYEYSLSGIVWFQGWNDLVDDKKMDEYGYNLENLIRDMRADFGTPNLPFLVGELGQQGLQPDPTYEDKHFRFRETQKAVTELPEFEGNALFVKTSPYVIKDGESFDGLHHYYGRADTFFHIGRAFGLAMLQLIAAP